jgi:hypothetical protein
MLSGLLMVWLSWIVLGTWAARWFGEQRNDDAFGCDGTKSIILTDVSVEDAAHPPRGLLDEAVISRAESTPKPRAQARRRSARGPPPASSMSVCRRATTTN